MGAVREIRVPFFRLAQWVAARCPLLVHFPLLPHATASSFFITTLSPSVVQNPVSVCSFMLSPPLSSSEPCLPMLPLTLSPCVASCCLLLFLHQNPVALCCSEPCLPLLIHAVFSSFFIRTLSPFVASLYHCLRLLDWTVSSFVAYYRVSPCRFAGKPFMLLVHGVSCYLEPFFLLLFTTISSCYFAGTVCLLMLLPAVFPSVIVSLELFGVSGPQCLLLLLRTLSLSLFSLCTAAHVSSAAPLLYSGFPGVSFGSSLEYCVLMFLRALSSFAFSF